MNNIAPTSPASSLSVALFVHGETMQPDEVTRMLGVRPTEARAKMDVRNIASGRQIIQKRGLWILRIQSECGDVARVVDELMSKMGNNIVDLSSISGFEEAYIDIYISMSPGSQTDPEFTFSLNPDNMELISRAGLPIQITYSVTMP